MTSILLILIELFDLGWKTTIGGLFSSFCSYSESANWIRTRLIDHIPSLNMTLQIDLVDVVAKTITSSSPIQIILFVLGSFLLVFLLLRSSTKLSFQNVESYTSTRLLINKIRILSILTLVLVPTLSYVETQILGLYEVDWFIVALLIAGVSIGFLISFYPRITHKQAKLIPELTFPFVYILLVYACFDQNMPITLSVETSIIILFAKLVYTNFRRTLYFLGFAAFINLVFQVGFRLDGALNFIIYMSVSIQAAILVIGSWLAEGASLNQLSFSRKVLESADIFVMVRDADGSIVYVNGFTCSETKLPEVSLLGDSGLFILDPRHATLDESEAYVLRALQGETESSFIQSHVIGVDSRQIEWQEFTLDGKYLISFGKDVSKEKILEQQYSFLIDNAQEAIYIADNNGKFLHLNKAMEEILEYSEPEIKNMTFTDVIHNHDVERVSEFYKEQLKNRDATSMLQFRVRTKSGKTKWISQSVKAVLSGPDSKRIKEFHCISRDTTDRVAYEEELQRLSLVAKKTKNIILIMDKQKRIEWVNDAFTAVFGYSSEEVIGKVPSSFLNGPKTDLPTLEKIDISLKHSRHIKTELLNYTKFDKEVWMEMVIDPIIGKSGETEGFIAVEQEITDRKQKEQIIELQNRDLMDSLEYSRRIQDSTISSKEAIRDILPDSGLIYLPKDIVSGDFYLVDLLKTDTMKNWPVFLVADCTGHGVPGALLSVLCSSILRQAFQIDNISDPSEILDYARQNLENFLVHQNENELLDGMDVALCVIDPVKHILHFSGANRPIWIQRNNEIITVAGDRQHIGFNTNPRKFTPHRIPLEPMDALFIFSDGICDQFGGDFGRRFTTKRLKEIILDTVNLNVDKQIQRIESEFVEWKDDSSQTDDVCLFTMRYNPNSIKK